MFAKFLLAFHSYYCRPHPRAVVPSIVARLNDDIHLPFPTIILQRSLFFFSRQDCGAASQSQYPDWNPKQALAVPPDDCRPDLAQKFDASSNLVSVRQSSTLRLFSRQLRGVRCGKPGAHQPRQRSCTLSVQRAFFVFSSRRLRPSCSASLLSFVRSGRFQPFVILIPPSSSPWSAVSGRPLLQGFL